MSSIRRSDPEYQQAMREAKELFDAAMAKSSTKGRVGRPKVAPAAAPVAAPDDADELAEISELEEIVEVEAAALEGAAEEELGDAPELGDDAEELAEGDGAAGKNGARKMRRRASDG
jgi:hypothetical protein